MSDVVPVVSDRCGIDDLFLDYGTEMQRGCLGLVAGWPRRWTATWRTSGGDVACAVRDLGDVPVAGCAPARRFTWRQRQRHRPGLQFMVSTGRLHGFESLEERSLLLALDFTGNSAQPGPSRRGAGPIPASLRICQTVDGATVMPSAASSPWIRRYPHDSFSRASRSTADRILRCVAGRPERPPRDRRAQRRRTMPRCHRTIVPGVTINRIAASRSAGTVPASSASHARSGHVRRECARGC